MLKRLFVLVFVGAMFVVAIQFASVLFSSWEFDAFTKDEAKFAPIREDDSKEHLVEHIKQEARFYGLTVDQKDISVDKKVRSNFGQTVLSVDVTYSAPVDLYYLTYQLHRHVHALARY